MAARVESPWALRRSTAANAGLRDENSATDHGIEHEARHAPAVGAAQHQLGVAALDGVTRTGEPMTRIASTHVFVDGNNVMGSRPDGWWRDRSGAARRLIAELDPVARRCGGEWMIVFDGLPSLDEEAEPASPLCVDYALRRGANAADDRIVELVAALPEGRNVLVYTSDRRLRERVSALGAQVRGAGVLRRLAGASRVDRDPRG